MIHLSVHTVSRVRKGLKKDNSEEKVNYDGFCDVNYPLSPQAPLSWVIRKHSHLFSAFLSPTSWLWEASIDTYALSYHLSGSVQNNGVLFFICGFIAQLHYYIMEKIWNYCHRYPLHLPFTLNVPGKGDSKIHWQERFLHSRSDSLLE